MNYENNWDGESLNYRNKAQFQLRQIDGQVEAVSIKLIHINWYRLITVWSNSLRQPR